MLRIYIGSITKDYCILNDAYFDRYIDHINFNSNLVKYILYKIDGVKYLGQQRVSSKFVKGIAISAKEMSSGCKTVLNVLSFSKEIFDIGECGDNALQVLFSLKSGNVYIPFFVIPPQFNNDIEIVINEMKKVIVHNNKDLENVLDKVFQS